jgi:molybdopterin-guanine dinucleotide biosynthesis protein A
MEAIVLAGGEEPWARKYGVRSKALVPYRGRPMAEWVLEALEEAGLAVIYVGENPGLSPAPRLTLPDRGSLLGNLEAALDHVEGKVLVATADIPHLRAEAVRFVLEKAPEAALVYPIVPKERVEARFPGNRRTYARLKEGTFTGGNLLLLDKALFFQALPLARRVVALRKNPLALARLTTLTQNSSAPTLKVFPNPAREDVSLVLPDTTLSWYTLTICDATGRQVYSTPYRGLTLLTLPTATWRSGLYWIHLHHQQNPKQTFQTTFIKL